MNTPWIPAEQNTIVREQLADGETVSWVGQEPRSHYLSNRILSIVGLSLAVLFTGFFTVFMLFMNPNIFQGQ